MVPRGSRECFDLGTNSLDAAPPAEDRAMNADDEMFLRTIYEHTTPMRYLGENPCGQFLFAQGSPMTTHIFNSLEAAMEEKGDVIVIEGNSIRSPRFHAGYNAGLMGKPYDPCTRIKDGAPRTLNETERQEYAHGYMHGIQMRPIKSY